MASEVFRFKHFEVSHSQSSMKIGVDAVLLGSWVNINNPCNILDVGTGCGIIAMIMAYRYPGANIIGIDNDLLSIEEAQLNFSKMRKDESLKALLKEFPIEIQELKTSFDLVISNPPFFNDGLKNPITRRERARHQSLLSVSSLIEHHKIFLNEKGILAMIFPFKDREEVMETAESNGLVLKRECRIKNNGSKPVKRIMTEFCRDYSLSSKHVLYEELTLFEEEGPTEQYRNLCKDLYLKF